MEVRAAMGMNLRDSMLSESSQSDMWSHVKSLEKVNLQTGSRLVATWGQSKDRKTTNRILFRCKLTQKGLYKAMNWLKMICTYIENR